MLTRRWLRRPDSIILYMNSKIIESFCQNNVNLPIRKVLHCNNVTKLSFYPSDNSVLYRISVNNSKIDNHQARRIFSSIIKSLFCLHPLLLYLHLYFNWLRQRNIFRSFFYKILFHWCIGISSNFIGSSFRLPMTSFHSVYATDGFKIRILQFNRK